VSQLEANKNCEEFGPNLTEEMASSGASFSLNSLLLLSEDEDPFDILMEIF
jgi:hypothetical protein